jgi:hypothetical protein
MAVDLLADEEGVDLLAGASSAPATADPLSENLRKIDEQTRAESFEEPGNFSYLFNRLKKGFAGFMGLPGDVVQMLKPTPESRRARASNPNETMPDAERELLLRLAAEEEAEGPATSYAGRVLEKPIATSSDYREILGVDPEMKTGKDWLRYTGGVAEMAGAGGPFGLAAKPATLFPLATGITGSGVGMEAGGDVASGLGLSREAGEAGGALAGGLVSAIAPNMAAKGAGALRRKFSPSAQKSLAESAASKEIGLQLESYPPAKANIARSLEVSDEMSKAGADFSPSLPARSGSPGLLAEEKRLVAQSPRTLNKAVERVEENQQAIRKFLDEKFKPVGGPTAASKVAALQKQSVVRLEGMKAAIDDKLDDAVRVFESNPDNFENGKRLRDLFFKQKEVYSGIRGQKYQAVYEAADRLGVKANIDDVVQYADDVLKNELNAYQASEIPPVFRQLTKELTDVPDDLKAFVAKQGGPSGEVSFAKLHSLYKRTNSDLASLRGSMSADKDFKIMLLEGLKTKLNGKLAAFEAEGFGEVATKLKEANRFYAQEYLPRFKQGFGGDIAARYSTGEFRTADQMITGMVTKANNTQAAKDFKLLFDDIPEAHQALRAGYLDELYRNTGVIGKDGRIVQRSLDTFLRKHEPTLKEFPAIKTELKQLALDNEALLARRAHIVAAEKKLAAQDLFKLFQGRDPTVVLTEAATKPNVMRALAYQARKDPNMAKGLTRGIAEHVAHQPDPAAFLAANEEAIRIGLKPLGDEHFKNLQVAVEAMTINARNPVTMTVGAGSISPDQLASGIGSSPRALVSAYLSVQRGRTGTEQEAAAILGRWFDKLRREHKLVAMEAVFYDKDTARALANVVKNPQSEKVNLDFVTQMTSLGVRASVAMQE